MTQFTAENYVRQWVANGRRNGLVRYPWEEAYQEAGVIQEAADRGYLTIGRNVGCDITLTPMGEALATNDIEAVIAIARNTQDRFTAYVRSQPVAPAEMKDLSVLKGVKFSAMGGYNSVAGGSASIHTHVPFVQGFTPEEPAGVKSAIDALDRAVAFYLTHLEAAS